MRKTYLALIIAAMMAATGPVPALAQSESEMNTTLDGLFGEHVPYRKFFDGLKQAVAANDKAAVAAMISYPFQARINAKAVKIKDTAHFIADYDKVVTAKVKQALAKQTYPTLFANWQGVMVGDGEIWFSGVGKDNKVKITAIND